MIPFLLSGLVLVPYYIWKARMAMNDPEKYRRFREWEEEEVARQKKIVRNAAAGGIKIVRRVRRLRKK